VEVNFQLIRKNERMKEILSLLNDRNDNIESFHFINFQTIDEDEEFFEAPGVYSLYTSEDLEVTYKIPRPKTCMTWNGNKIKTFDGVQFTHELICSHTLVQDIDGTFSIILRACPYESIQPCAHALEIFTQSERFTFEKSVDGRVKMFTTKKEIPIPVQMTGLRVTLSGLDVRVLLEQIPITITWNSEVSDFSLMSKILLM
jgi:von Willebrand factor